MNPFKIMVAGAGRGPLVQAAIEICEYLNITYKTIIYAVEKNPNAMNTLKFRKNSEKWTNVELIQSDMRNIHMENQIDIVVSELLGSFGDNELSPECLDELLPQVLKEDGISIPYRYTNYLQPISSSLIFTNIILQNQSFENPFICLPFNYYPLAPVEECFKFEHPTNDINHSRDKTMRFTITHDAVLHGFSGTFNLDLYKNIKLSIVPFEHTPDMYSWYPLFFPLMNPIQVKKGDVVELRMWRCCSPQTVWYEWIVISPEISRLHNAGGKYHMKKSCPSN